MNRKHFICTVKDCNNIHLCKGFCKKHYTRWKKGQPINYTRPDISNGWISNGYKHVMYKKKPILEHRLIIELHLKRTLKSSEIVHHKDGNPLNNKIENLEIMSNATHSNIHNPKNYCTVNKCNNKHAARGFCKKHYARWAKHGNPLTLQKKGQKPFKVKT